MQFCTRAAISFRLFKWLVQQVSAQHATRSWTQTLKLDSAQNWREYKEAIPTYDNTPLRENRIVDQMRTTNDTSDYLWYTFR